MLILAGCGNTPALITSSPRTLTLSLSQLPFPGFIVENGSATTGVISNSRAAAGDAALLRRFESEGRESGYIATFVREVSPQAVVGPVVIESTAATYRSVGGAASGLRQGASTLVQTGWQQVSTGSLGQRAVGFTETKALAQTEYQSFVILWLQANVVNEIRIAGNAATLDLTYALALARVQQRDETAR